MKTFLRALLGVSQQEHLWARWGVRKSRFGELLFSHRVAVSDKCFLEYKPAGPPLAGLTSWDGKRVLRVMVLLAVGLCHSGGNRADGLHCGQH